MTPAPRFRHAFRLGLALFTLAGIGIVSAQNQNRHFAEMDKLRKTNACVGCDLSGMDFSRQNLKGADLSGANLDSVMFYRADLSGANLGGANLTKANLSFADLTNTNLGSADLTGANLSSSIAAAIAGSKTTDTTTCPDGQAGPCR